MIYKILCAIGALGMLAAMSGPFWIEPTWFSQNPGLLTGLIAMTAGVIGWSFMKVKGIEHPVLIAFCMGGCAAWVSVQALPPCCW